jgi:hypothetical protein
LFSVDRISELETETIRSQAQVARLEQELGRVLQHRDHLEDQLRRLGGARKAGQEENGGGDIGGGGIIHSVHILTGGENTKNSQSQNFNPRGLGGSSGGVSNSYFHHQQQQQHHPYQHHPARLLSQSETNLATAAAGVDGAINIEIRHNNGSSNGDNNLSRSSGDLLGNRLGGGMAASKAGGVSVVNLPAVVNNSAGSSAEELYYGGDSAGGGGSGNIFSRFGGGSNGATGGNSRYNNYLYPDRPRFFPQQLQHNNNGRLAAFNSIAGGRSTAVGGKLQQLLSQERLLHNRSRSVENLLFDQQAAGGGGLRYAATASSEISLQPRPAYYGETMRSAASATAVGGGGNGRSQHYQQRMKATQSEQFLTKIGKLEKVRRQIFVKS